MGTASSYRATTRSQKVYGWLLHAYPKTHRQAYGPAMAQLFRDQCRDAWEEEQGRGIFKLWLRVLPDLVSTSIAERLTALKERKTMTDKLADMSRFRGATPFATFASVFIAVFLIVFLASVVITFLLPETYASTARIVTDGGSANTLGNDPYSLQTTFEIIQSEPVLIPVIEKLNLNAKWGERYAHGQIRKTPDTLVSLRSRIFLDSIRNTHYVSITTYSQDPQEAAQIANTIAESYRDYRVKLEEDRAAKAVAVMQAQFKDRDAQIRAAQTEADSLRATLKITGNAASAQSPLEKPYWDKKRELDQMTEQQQALGHDIDIQLLNSKIPQASPVIISDAAEPSRRPARPNKTLNIVVGAFSGIVLGAVAGGAAVAITLLKKRSRITLAKS